MYSCWDIVSSAFHDPHFCKSHALCIHLKLINASSVKYSGYMSPEYILHGLFSDRSDVFSFGVLLLEIISGKKNCGVVPEFDPPSNLISSVSGTSQIFNIISAFSLIDS